MKVNAEKLNNTRVQATVEIPVADFEASLEKAYHIVVKKVNIPGFRKGKAPRKMLENIYGREILLEDALQDAVPKAFKAALDELKDQFTAVGEPEYEVLENEKDCPVVFKASFDIKPEVVLGQYKGLELEKPSQEIKPEDVDKEIEKMRQRYAKLVSVDGEAQSGDVLTIDFLGKVAEQPFPGGKGENYDLELGSNTFIPGFEEQLIGAVKDQVNDVKVKFPDGYHAEELAGQDAVFTVTIKEIKRKEFSALDDEFAKDVSEFETMQELRDDMENKLKATKAKGAEAELRQAAIKKAADNTDVEIPNSMVEGRISTMIQEFAYRMQQQGISLEYYLQATKSDIESLKGMYRPGAESSVKADLILEAIAKAENIKAEPEDIDKEFSSMAELYNQDAAKIREMMEMQGQLSAMEYSIMLDKAADLIIKEAVITEKVVSE